MKHSLLKHLLLSLALLMLVVVVAFGDNGNYVEIEITSVDNVDKAPFDSVGLIEAQAHFSSGCLVGSQRTVLTTLKQMERTRMPYYYWYGKWNEGEISPYQRKDVRIPLRSVWILSDARGYASFHKDAYKIPKAGDDLALLQSYEDLGSTRDITQPLKTKYTPKAGKKMLVGYPQGGPENNTLKTMSPLLRSMQQTDLGNAALESRYYYKGSPWIQIKTKSGNISTHEFFGNEGGPLFTENDDGSWQLIAILARVSEVPMDNQPETLIFHLIDETTFKNLIEPALPKANTLPSD